MREIETQLYKKCTFFAFLPSLSQKYLHISAGSFPNSKKRPFVGTNFWACVAGDRYVSLLPGTENLFRESQT
jgi:hypothetical protein